MLEQHPLTGVNYFNYSNPIDNNGDNFTDDATRPDFRFQKWNFNRKKTINFFFLADAFMKTDGAEKCNGTLTRGGK
jgi:outer membrane receptor for ferrienterochelin and colicins